MDRRSRPGARPDRSVPITASRTGADYPSPSGAAGALTALNPIRASEPFEARITVGSVSKAAHAVADGRGGRCPMPGRRESGSGCKIVRLWPAIGR